jgi:hypothetical protein
MTIKYSLVSKDQGYGNPISVLGENESPGTAGVRVFAHILVSDMTPDEARAQIAEQEPRLVIDWKSLPSMSQTDINRILDPNDPYENPHVYTQAEISAVTT